MAKKKAAAKKPAPIKMADVALVKSKPGRGKTEISAKKAARLVIAAERRATAKAAL